MIKPSRIITETYAKDIPCVHKPANKETMSMWRSKFSSENIRSAGQWKGQERTGKDIIQLYNNECKAQRERHRKILEIQRKARRKDEPNRKLLELQAKAAEIRQNSQTKASVIKLPPIPIQSQTVVTRRGIYKQTAVMGTDEHFLPNIGVINNSRVITTNRGVTKKSDPSRDPRFQSLIACLLTSEEYFGDLQRYAPPRKEIARQKRVGLSF